MLWTEVGRRHMLNQFHYGPPFAFFERDGCDLRFLFLSAGVQGMHQPF